MENDCVIGVFEPDRLSQGLATIHRAGLGVNARVLDRDRGDLAGQAQRLGIADVAPTDATVSALLFVYAPGRLPAAIEAMRAGGARSIHVTRLGGPPGALVARGLELLPAARSARVSLAGRSASAKRPLLTRPSGDDAQIGDVGGEH